MQITVRAGPAERQVTAQCQHMIYAMLQICIQLLLDTFLVLPMQVKWVTGVVLPEALIASSTSRFLQRFRRLRRRYMKCNRGSARTGAPVRRFTDQLLHAYVSLRGKYLEGKRSFSRQECLLRSSLLPPSVRLVMFLTVV